MATETRGLVQLTVTEGDDAVSVMDKLLAKSRAADRKEWLTQKGDRAEV
jgi:topoisomerase-4 subunit B